MIQWKQPNTSAIVCSTSKLKQHRDNVSVSVSLPPLEDRAVCTAACCFVFFFFSLRFTTPGSLWDSELTGRSALHAPDSFVVLTMCFFVPSAAEAARPRTRGAELEARCGEADPTASCSIKEQPHTCPNKFYCQ